jgi:uncharacterized membrane protein (DUF106 family)
MIFLGTFFTITNTDISAMISKGANFISDFMPLLVILVGILIGIFIIRMITIIERKEIPEEERKAIHEAFEREEREYRKVQEMIKRKDVKGLEKWLEKWRKGEVEW